MSQIKSIKSIVILLTTIKTTMQKILSFGIIIFTLVILTGCHLANNSKDKLWFYIYSSNVANADTMLTPASFINLQGDGTYTRDFGYFDYGKWDFKNDHLILTNTNNETLMLAVDMVSANEMQISNHNTPVENFESLPGSFSGKDQNPFSLENNLWRITPAKKETDAEIKNRLLNHFKFWEKYFTWALNNELKTVDVRSTPTLLKIYGNGFTLKTFDQLPAEWKSFFYDSADCQIANDKMKYFIDNNNIAWPHTENKYKMFISAFQQLQQKFK
jgi:hypothetical protein